MGPDKGGELPPKVPKPPPPPPHKEQVPKLKIFPSEKIFRRKSTFVEYPFKRKGSSFDSVHNKVSRSSSQTKRKVSPSDVMPKRRMSASEPRFQRRISLTEFPGSRKISPSGSPPYQKLGSPDFEGEIKHTKRKKLSKAVTLTHDPSYHQEGLSDLSPSPYNVRKFFPDTSTTPTTTTLAADKLVSTDSISLHIQPKNSPPEPPLPPHTPIPQIKPPKSSSRESIHSPFPHPLTKPLKISPSSGSHSTKSSPLHHDISQTGKKERLFSVQRKPPPSVQPLLIKHKPPGSPLQGLKRQFCSPMERDPLKSHAKVYKRELPPPMPIISTDELSPIDSLPQLIRRASCKPAHLESSTLISLPSSTLVHEKQLPLIPRQQSLPAEPYPPKPKESKQYERLK